MRTGGLAALLLGFLTITGCRTGRNYVSAEGPRYAGSDHLPVWAVAILESQSS